MCVCVCGALSLRCCWCGEDAARVVAPYFSLEKELYLFRHWENPRTHTHTQDLPTTRVNLLICFFINSLFQHCYYAVVVVIYVCVFVSGGSRARLVINDQKQ